VALSAPEPLSDHHALDAFDSGVAVLDDWLKRRARANHLNGASRCYILSDGDAVAGYYALASGSVMAVNTTGRFRRNMPDPIPVAVLGRLAVGRHHQRQGIGRALFRDAVLRVLQAAETIGIRGIVVHAISEDAKAFYLSLGLELSPLEPMTLLITLADARAALE
jgi:GNAT superfamily N-acetyltransferase